LILFCAAAINRHCLMPVMCCQCGAALLHSSGVAEVTHSSCNSYGASSSSDPLAAPRRFVNGQNGMPTSTPGSLWLNHFVSGSSVLAHVVEPDAIKVGGAAAVWSPPCCSACCLAHTTAGTVLPAPGPAQPSYTLPAQAQAR
jgi:hypothetical protein